MENKFDLTVVGGGPGGYTAAIRASQLGLKVAVIEERELGGTCLNRGCIPTKALLHSSELYHMVRHCSDYGINADNVDFDFGQMSKRKDFVVRQLRSGVESLLKNNGAAIIQGRAFFKDRNTVEVFGKEYTSIKTTGIIIATGSKPSTLPVKGAEGNKVLDSDKVLELKESPNRVVIIGGGVIGVEFASIFNNLGKDVTIIEMTDSLIPGVDTEISGLLEKSMRSKGIKIYKGSKVIGMTSGDAAICSFETQGELLKASGDIIIVAAGRKPNLEGLGLENLSIAIEKGFIKVNEHMVTSATGVFAIGDVTGKLQLAHVASAQGLVAAANAAGKKCIMDYHAVPSCVYTNPEIAAVGMTEQEAANKKIPFAIGKFPIAANGKSVVMGEREGMVKIITDSSTGEIIGAHMLAPRATDMISEICVAMKLESTIEELSETVHPHPTVSESIMEAACDAKGRSIHKVKRG